jgi:hypothetical protein
MFRRIHEYPLIEWSGLWRPRAYGDPQPDGTWDGWLVFFPVAVGLAVAPPGPETTQSTLEQLIVWAAGLSAVYLEGALARALKAVEQPALAGRVAGAEYEALEDAEALRRERLAVEREVAAIAADAAHRGSSARISATSHARTRRRKKNPAKK